MTYVQANNRATYNAMVLSLRGNPNRSFHFQVLYTLSRTPWIFLRPTRDSIRTAV